MTTPISTTAISTTAISDNVWRHRDADGGIHAVVDSDNEGIVIDGREFTRDQAAEFACSILMMAAPCTLPSWISLDPTKPNFIQKLIDNAPALRTAIEQAQEETQS